MAWNDTVRIGRAFYKIQYFSKNADTVILQNVAGEAQLGYKVGYYAYNFKQKDISTGQFIGLADFNNKYLLMEYWGTWCAPCVGLHDDIVNLLKINNQVSYLGVAYDTDAEKVKNYLSNSPSMRRQLFEKMGSQKSNMVNLYRVQNYPTFILIKKGGEIVFRDYGTEGFTKLKDFLKASN